MPLLRRFLLLETLGFCLALACTSKLRTYEQPSPVDTATRPVRLLPETTFRTPSGVLAKADFPGARLASFTQVPSPGPDSPLVFVAEVPAENQPINTSPWYAMALSAPDEREVVVRLTYPVGVGNRYLPKTTPRLSGPYTYVPTSRYDTAANANDVRLTIGPALTYLTAQEVINTDSVRRYLRGLTAERPALRWDTIGTSALGRPIWKLDTGADDDDRRPATVLMSRQHPPEVTGFQAFQAFLGRVLEDDALARRFREGFRVIAFPTVNPDGVDEGHWRHNAGGVDLNRDWGYYRQPEVRQVVEWLQAHTKRQQVVWGMDFHSTQYDVLYTHDPAEVDFRGADGLRAWTEALEAFVAERYAPPYQPARTPTDYPQAIVGQDTLRIEPEGIRKPTSASWFATHYGGVGVTYEVADEQDRGFLREKAREAAELWMGVLLRDET